MRAAPTRACIRQRAACGSRPQPAGAATPTAAPTRGRAAQRVIRSDAPPLRRETPHCVRAAGAVTEKACAVAFAAAPTMTSRGLRSVGCAADGGGATEGRQLVVSEAAPTAGAGVASTPGAAVPVYERLRVWREQRNLAATNGRDRCRGSALHDARNRGPLRSAAVGRHRAQACLSAGCAELPPVARWLSIPPRRSPRAP